MQTNLVTHEVESDDTFLYAHHVIKEPDLIPLNINPYMYFNFFSETLNTVDWQYISSIINIQMGSAIQKDMMQSSGSLMGLMVGMSSPAPSIMAVMTCMAIFNIEIGSTRVNSNYAQTVVAKIQEQEGDATIPSSRVKDADYYIRMVDVNYPTATSKRYLTKKLLFNSIGIFLGTILLFDKMRKSMPITDKKENYPDYYRQFEIAYNISAFTFHENLSYPTTYMESFAMTMCPLLLNVGGTQCIKKRGGYLDINYYVTPISSTNKHIHNVLFRNSFPRLKNNYYVALNNLTALIYRYLFYAQFSNFDTVLKFTNLWRKIETEDVPFEDYIFDYSGDNEEESSYISKVGLDTIPDIIFHLKKYDNDPSNYKSDFITLYNEIVKLATTAFKIYGKYMAELPINNGCTIKGYHPMGSKYKEFDNLINEIQTTLRVSPIARYGIGALTDRNSPLRSGVGYEIMSPLIGSWADNGNLIAGFFQFYAGTMVNTWLRYHSVNNVYCLNTDDLVDKLKNNYTLDEVGIPVLNLQELQNYADMTDGGSLSCIKNFIQIPNILHTIIPELSMRGIFNDNTKDIKDPE